MKKAILLIVALVIVCFTVVYIVSVDGSKWVEDAWDDLEDDSGASSNGEWGTEVEIEYEDGTNETLKIVVAPSTIIHDSKNVSRFKYKLSSRGSSNQLSSCLLDLSGFWVDGSVTADGASVWDADVTHGTEKEIALDDNWHEVYVVVIEAEDITIEDGDYKLEFIPDGTIFYRGHENSDWVEIKGMPSSCWLTFTVDNFWIKLEFEGGIE